MTQKSPLEAIQRVIFAFKRVLFCYTDKCSELCS